MRVEARQFSGLLPARFGLPSARKSVKCEVGNRVLPRSLKKLAGAFRFELKFSVLETDVLPIETTRL